MKNSLEILLEIQNHVFSLVKEVDLLKSDKRKLIDEINILKNKLDSYNKYICLEKICVGVK